MSERLYLDAPSLVYRAFFALPVTIVDPKGQPVNAVRGFMEMVTRLIVDRRPESIVTVFDHDFRPALRVKAYPGYKADRPEDPPELPVQFDILTEVLEAAGIERVEAPDLEADDALATLMARKMRSEEAAVVTGDRDLLALVRDPDIRLLYPVRGVSELADFDEAGVEKKFGVPPRLYSDFATLRGDPSDGLPGVAGIGPVRATKLLDQYGSVDGILENLDRLPTKQAAVFEAARSYLEAMRTVVGLVTDAELRSTAAHSPDPDALERLARERNLGSSAARLSQALSGHR